MNYEENIVPNITTIRAFNLGCGRFSADKHLGELSFKARLETYRQLFMRRSQNIFKELSQYFSQPIAWRVAKEGKDKPAIEAGYYLGSLLAQLPSQERKGAETVIFNQSLIVKLACFIEPEALAQMLACLIQGNEVGRSRPQAADTDKDLSELLLLVLSQYKTKESLQVASMLSTFLPQAFEQTLELLVAENVLEEARPAYPRARLLSKRLLQTEDLDGFEKCHFSVTAATFGGDIVWVPVRESESPIFQNHYDARFGRTTPLSDWPMGEKNLLKLAGIVNP